MNEFFLEALVQVLLVVVTSGVVWMAARALWRRFNDRG
jgi:hypothetical protein